jgi:hypothetical protein
MTKWAHSDVLDGGLNAIRNNATRMILIKAYTAGDSYATVVANAVCTVTMASGDYTLSGSANNPRVCTTGAKSSTASANSGATPDLHIAFTDNVSKVLWVTDETSDQVVTSGNTVNFPALTFTSNQPT